MSLGQKPRLLRCLVFGILLVGISLDTGDCWLVSFDACAAAGRALVMMALLVQWCGQFLCPTLRYFVADVVAVICGKGGGFVYRSLS